MSDAAKQLSGAASLLGFIQSCRQGRVFSIEAACHASYVGLAISSILGYSQAQSIFEVAANALALSLI